MRYFIQHDYHNKPAFSGFLPGIAGVHGIPLWAFYVNRGQGMAGFGIESKDGCIAEYHSAQKAYRLVREQGFRTFIRVSSGEDTIFYEPFVPENRGTRNEFRIGLDEISLLEVNNDLGMSVEIIYRTVAGAPVAGLVREVKVTNMGSRVLSCEILDGLPFVVPAGVDYQALTTMLTTARAWMKVVPVATMGALYRVAASMQDTASVEVQKRVNFVTGLRRGRGKSGGLTPLQPIYDPDILFPPNRFMSIPSHFVDCGLEGLRYDKQIKEGKQHCAFFGDSLRLGPSETYELVEMYGGGEDERQIVHFVSWFRSDTNHLRLLEAGKSVTAEIVKKSYVRTSNPVFNAYCEQNYLDNVLRGGFPHIEGDGENWAGTYIPVYSRKHGDLERDYNWFVIPPEYYSQGWGNYRDVNQNRRSDMFFAPSAGKEILKEFISLIQTDGYNPLLVKGRTYRLPAASSGSELGSELGFELGFELCFGAETGPWVDMNQLPLAMGVVSSAPFSPGSLYDALRSDMGPDRGSEISAVFSKILAASQVEYNAEHGEGFWIDHWTYNNDLIENVHALFPDRAESLFWGEREYPYFTSGHTVLPRKLKWKVTDAGVRQYEAVKAPVKGPGTAPSVSWMLDANGDVYFATLGEKLLGLAALKFLGRDPFGIGIEMEAGKPGWYDALNGLPGLLGSSLPEAWELLRLIRNLLTFALRPDREKQAEVAKEIYELYYEIQEFLKLPVHEERDLHLRWHSMASCREEYREKTAEGFSGRRICMDMAILQGVLQEMEQDVLAGLERSKAKNKGVLPCYLIVQPKRPEDIRLLFTETSEPRVPDFSFQALPLFLEGFVRALALQPDRKAKQTLHKRVMNSTLYDKKLSMLRVNAPLDGLSHEIGRARAFTPGWLENGSIWLHMQYKYLLALLHAGLYPEFLQLSRTMLVPFMDHEVYGRSPYENSSFIVSSLHPDESLHGRGFVARLSGSTAEFISILQICLWGRRPFRYEQHDRHDELTQKQLQLVFEPCLPEKLFDGNRELSAFFLGDALITYVHKSYGDIFPGGEIEISKMVIKMKQDGPPVIINGSVVPAPYSEAFRSGKIDEVRIELDRTGEINE